MPEIAGSQLGKTQTASGLTQEVIGAGENEATVVAKSESATQQAGMLAKEESTVGTDVALTGEKTATNVEEGVVANSKASAVAGEDSSATQQLAQICTGTACFIAGTLVETVHGLRPIETLGLGWRQSLDCINQIQNIQWEQKEIIQKQVLSHGIRWSYLKILFTLGGKLIQLPVIHRMNLVTFIDFLPPILKRQNGIGVEALKMLIIHYN